MPELLMTIFESLNQAKIQYCVLRDAERLGQADKKIEIDLLIHQDQLPQLRSLLLGLGFMQLPDWGHAPHHFFLTYQSDEGSWLKLDVVTEIAYGHPVHALRTGLAPECLAKRQRLDLIFIPSPDYEFVTLLLHCMLDKGVSASGNLAPSRLQRLSRLRGEISDENSVVAILASLGFPDQLSAKLLSLVNSEDWEALFAEREAVSSHLERLDWFGTHLRNVLYPILRKFNRWMDIQQPRSIAVALLAPDGAGKSTLAKGIKDSFYFPVRLVYMGIYQKENPSGSGIHLPGVSFLRRLVRQWGRSWKARLYRARGELVIFDRHTYDELLASSDHQSRLKRWRRWLLTLGSPKPDLVIFLDAPGDVLYARKGEHTPDFLEQRRQAYLHLLSKLPNVVIIDAAQDAKHVRHQAMALIWKAYLAHQINRDPELAKYASTGERLSQHA